MVFNSYIFILFFSLFVFVHYLPLSWTIRKVNLLLASYVFYAAWSPPFVILLILAALMDFCLARWLFCTASQGLRKFILIFSISLNLGLLVFFKYGSFLLDNALYVMQMVNLHYALKTPDIILPLGISFYTFETISYLIDVYRKKLEPTKSFLDYALFLTFFPHLVAGPIVRAGDFLPQCGECKKFNGQQFGWGLVLMLIGLFEKVVLADHFLAPVADKVYNSAMNARFIDAWTGTLAFSGQIFFDFSGYSLCGIGAAQCLGFVLKDNFHFPYAAIGFSDFWARWHISLSSWLRDYLYISLGGNRAGKNRTYLNLMTTMLLGGLWHGASWRFVAWGGLHGIYLIGEKLINTIVGESPFLKINISKFFLSGITFFLVCITWVFFRGETFESSFHLIKIMFSPALSTLLVNRQEVIKIGVLILGLILFQYSLRDYPLQAIFEKIPQLVLCLFLCFVILSLIIIPGANRAFIYFQF